MASYIYTDNAIESIRLHRIISYGKITGNCPVCHGRPDYYVDMPDGDRWRMCDTCVNKSGYVRRECDYEYCRTCHPEAAKARDHKVPGGMVGNTGCCLQ